MTLLAVLLLSAPNGIQVLADHGLIPYGMGRSLAASGSTIVVGAQSRELQGRAMGDFAVYVYEQDRPVQRFANRAHHAQSRFGCNVAIRGDILAVGGCPEGSLDPSVVVYGRVASGWAELGRHHDPDRRSLGIGLALDSSGVVVSDGNVVSVLGDTLERSQTLSMDGLDSFGTHLALDGDTLVVGATRPFQLSRRLQASAPIAVVYKRRGREWVHERTLRPAKIYTFNGTRVAVDGPWIAVAAQTIEDRRPTVRGTVWIYERATGKRVTTLEGAGRRAWGAAIALQAGQLLVSDPARGAVTLHSVSGRALGEWTEPSGRFLSFGSDVAFGAGGALALGPSGLVALR